MKQRNAKWRNKRITLLVAFFASLVLFQACVSEDDLDFPDPDPIEDYESSIAIISLLRAVEKGYISEENTCFELLFPMELQFNNDIQITVEDFAGLTEVATSVTSDLHIDGIAFPFIVRKGGVIRTNSDESDFIEILELCEIPTLREEVDHFYTQCFDFEYPIQMVDVDDNVVTINNQEAYFDFELEQGFDEQPVFIFPLAITQYRENVLKSIDNAFEFFTAFDNCKKCPRLFFSYDLLQGSTYEFVADFDGITDISGYDWWIDGRFIERDGVDAQGDNRLVETFESGWHEVCIKVASEADDCVAGVEYCETFFVEDPCPFVSFTATQINDFTYLFEANFEAKDRIEYTWVVYQNSDLIAFETEGPDGDNQFEFQFDPGSYVVCVEAEPEDCPEVLKFCEEFFIQ